MSKLRRYYEEGNLYFLTLVSFDREPILVDHADLLLESLSSTAAKTGTQVLAWVVLRDHLHLVVDTRKSDPSKFVHDFKLSFAAKYRKTTRQSAGRTWQHRFWDHIIRDQDDLNHHIDYIHFNPVKHGISSAPIEYRLSSFGQFVNEGFYSAQWGDFDESRFEGDYGE